MVACRAVGRPEACSPGALPEKATVQQGASGGVADHTGGWQEFPR